MICIYCHAVGPLSIYTCGFPHKLYIPALHLIPYLISATRHNNNLHLSIIMSERNYVLTHKCAQILQSVLQLYICHLVQPSLHLHAKTQQKEDPDTLQLSRGFTYGVGLETGPVTVFR